MHSQEYFEKEEQGGSRIQVQISEYTIKLLQTNKYIISLKVDKTINTTE